MIYAPVDYGQKMIGLRKATIAPLIAVISPQL